MILLQRNKYMSRSYKRTPIVKQTTMGSKRIANRRYRRILNNSIDFEFISNRKNNNYRKHYESWNIHDYSFYRSRIGNYKEYLEYICYVDNPMSLKEWTKNYNKVYRFK